MRTQDWFVGLCVLASGCSVIVDNKLDGKPVAIAPGGGDGDGDITGDGDGDMGGGDAGGDGDMMAGDGDGDGPGPDGGSAFTRADVQVCLGATHGCRLFPSGMLICWGSDSDSQTSLTEGSYKDVACGDYHTCAVTAAGGVSCAGRNRDGQRDAPTSGSYKAVVAGDAHSCALKADDTAFCWGNNNDGQTSVPAGVTFSSIAAGGAFTCGIRKSDSKIQCWGSTSSNRLKPPTDSTFKAIDLGENYGCGITSEGAVRCWGNIAFMPPDLQGVRAISTGEHACAVLNNKSGTCWPDSPLPLPDTYIDVAAGPSGYLFTPETGAPQYYPPDPAYDVPPNAFYESF